MTKKKNRNALIHGFYSSDVLMPWEKEQDFRKLLEGLRLDFNPKGTTEDEEVFGIALLRWKQRGIHRALQLSLLGSSAAAEIAKSGKRSARGIHRALNEREGRDQKEEQLAAAVASLAESMSALAELAAGNNLGKLGANLRSVIHSIEELGPQLMAAAKSQTAEKISHDPYGLDHIAHLCELQERLDGLVEKKVKRLAMFREFQRQYGGADPTVQIIEHRLPQAQPESARRSEENTSVLNVTAKKKKSTTDNDRDSGSANDNDNHDYQLDRDLEA
jgi:hypothetical protein